MGTMRRVLPGPLKKKTLKNFNGQKKDNKERVEVVGSTAKMRQLVVVRRICCCVSALDFSLRAA